jgi:hypothetical protein
MNVEVKVSVKDETDFLGRTTNQKSPDVVEVCFYNTGTQYMCALPYDRNSFQGPSQLLFKGAIIVLQDIGVVMSQKRR